MAAEVVRVFVPEVDPLFREARVAEGPAIASDKLAQSGEGLRRRRGQGGVLLRRPLLIGQQGQQHAPGGDHLVHRRTAQEVQLYRRVRLQKRGTARDVVGVPALQLPAQGPGPEGFRREGGERRERPVFVVGGGVLSGPEGRSGGHGQQRRQQAEQKGPL